MRKPIRLVVAFTAILLLLAGPACSAEDLALQGRRRIPVEWPGEGYRMVNERLDWAAEKTAVLVCDMWDRHWCAGASQRVEEMAPVMNNLLGRLRNTGVVIIHAPSECMEFYRNHPARKHAQSAPAVEVPDFLKSWNGKIESEEGHDWPIDQSDGGCDCQPPCRVGQPWKRQHAAIDIRQEDYISDSGVEIARILQDRGIENVILVGVHTNMCVIGRPFGLRNMVRWGKNVVLMRDMTDTMYNSRMAPRVNHFAGTSLVVEYIETFICPTVASTEITGRPPFRFDADKRPKVVFMMAEKEYHADQCLPEFGRLLENEDGVFCDYAVGKSQANGIDRHSIENMETLADADAVVVFVRRRALPEGQFRYLEDHLRQGRPLVGIRTASHAFDAREKIADPDGGKDADGSPRLLRQWPEFDREVLGGDYSGHYGDTPDKTRVQVVETARSHPIVSGLDAAGFISPAKLYRTKLVPTAVPLLIGHIQGEEPEPVTWTHRYGDSRVFSTSLGDPGDWEIEAFRRMMVNGLFWAMDRPAPQQ